MQNIKDLAASLAKTWGEIAQVIDNNFKGTTDAQKNDLNYVRALDASGNPILISKEDLAQVVGGLLPGATASEKGLMTAYDYNEIEQKLDLRGYKMLCICKYNNLWNPIEPIVISLQSGLIYITASLNESVSNNSVSCRLISGDSLFFKIYKKVEDNYLKIYIYCISNSNAPRPIWLKRKNIVEEPIEVTDLSGYTEITIQ